MAAKCKRCACAPSSKSKGFTTCVQRCAVPKCVRPGTHHSASTSVWYCEEHFDKLARRPVLRSA